MQNLTAHYNILYNAKELINLSEKNIQLNYSDNYDRLISVYKEPNESLSQSELKNLDEALLKANTIANEKSLSKYVDDAYFLIGKANHLKSNFFNAVEFFNYVYNNYPAEKEIRQASLAWKARSLIASDRLEEAESTLDTAINNIETEKKSVADIYATRAQLYIYAKQDEEAINLLEKALKNVKNKQKKIRWTYLIAQLYEITGQAEKALSNYTKVIKSNAPFDMAFNANLSRINLKTELSGDNSGKTREIMALLKDDKNRELLDLVYFQIANSYAQANNSEKAIENYNLALSKSTKNLNLKGLAYLELAEIYFKKSDFLMSKAYYDSTLISLPKNYPDYLLIKKKADNLEVLANSLNIIAQQDTLQMLAQLPDAVRKERIGKMMLAQTEKAQAGPGVPVSGNTFMPTSQSSANSRDTRFYFNNSAALRQGLADFKKRWGPRKLEDNWRRSLRTASEMPSAILPDPGSIASPFPMQEIKTEAGLEERIKEYLLSVPVSPEQKAESNQKIASALYDIANYYRDISADTAEAVKTYEQLLNRFPENQNKLAVYYNLYRLYSTANKKRSEEYKNILLTKFPESPFAKIIIDPDFSQKQDEQEAAFNRLYNGIYDLYVKKNYPEMLNSVEKYRQASGVQKVPAQLAYLNSLAIGHTQKLPYLENAFKEIVSNFPDEKLIVPLVKQHLAFIDSNRAAMADRLVALSDMNFNNRFFQETEIEQPVTLISEPVDNKPVIVNNEKPETLKPENESETGLFRKDDSAEHYFVVNISDPSVNLSSSRFGIGQFNRANLPGSAIKHQLKSVANQNQLIFVGPFSGKEAVITYFTNISPLMRAIMKIPVGKYSSFIINSQNLEKIIDKETLDLYVEYYKKNY